MFCGYVGVDCGEVVFMSCCVMVPEFVLMFVVYLVILNWVCFLILGVGL